MNMKIRIACLAVFSLLMCFEANAQTNSYLVTPIIDNTQDEFLINPWGMSRPVKPGLPDNFWWLSDNLTGYTTLYDASKDGAAALAPLVISIPTATGTGVGSPTGTVYNGTAGPGPGVHNFTFATLDGTISNFNMGEKPPPGGTSCFECHRSSATIKVNNSSTGASYLGLTVANRTPGNMPTYYATNFTGKKVEAYDATTFAPVTLSGRFADPTIPRSYKPYGIQAVSKQIWVTFYNGISGGFVNGFDFNGKLKVRLAAGSFSEPWGIAQAPANFGAFSNMLLVGNTTSGMIGAYSPTTGAFQGFLQDATGSPIVLPGLWGISFGNGSTKAGPINVLYYAAGGPDETTGVFGEIRAN